MAKNNQSLCGIELDSFLENHNLSRSEFNSTGLKPAELDAIAQDFGAQRQQLTHVANLAANTLQQVPKVHSVKVRLKSPDGLVAKIIRKKISEPTREIRLDNYESEITDLIGARALHLFKDEWEPVSKFIRSHWDQHEDPVAYYRNGDPVEVVQAFSSASMKTEEHKAGYRSVHHIVSCSPSKKIHLIEIQVRTIFEEAWSEIDHIVRYPRKTDDKELDSFLMLFNSFAGNADSMGTFLIKLRQRLLGHADMVGQLKARADAAETELQKTISKLNVSAADQDRLREEVAKLHNASVTSVTLPYIISTSASPMYITAAPESQYLSIVNTTKTCPMGHSFQAPPKPALSVFAGTPCPICKTTTY